MGLPLWTGGGMKRILVGLGLSGLGLSGLGLAPADAVPARAATSGEAVGGTIGEAMARAVALCEKAVQARGALTMDLPRDAELFHPQLGETAPDVAKLPAAAPPLVQRFVQTLPWRMVEAPTMMVRYRATQGEAWAVVGARSHACDMMVTGSVDAAAGDALVGAMAGRGGWQVAIARPAPQHGMLSQHVLVKRMPTAAAPDWGMRAKVQSLGLAPETRDGVQVQVGFVIGTIVTKPATAP